MATASIAQQRARSRGVRTGVDLLLTGVLGALLIRVFLWPTLRHAYPFPVGPDVPVYLWWTRVAEYGGISMASERPGAPALIGTLQGVLGQGVVGALAGLQYALGPTIGLAAAALARGRGRTLPRGGWLAAGVLAGAWATFLGGGYVSNLVFAAAFLAAAASLAARTRRGAFVAAIVLGGGALTHPGFFVVGAVVLGVTGLWAAWHEGRFGWRTDAGRVATALGGALAIFGIGLAAAQIGPPRVTGETSGDAFMRHTGQLESLRRSYLDRYLDNWRRYSPFMTSALAFAGAFRAHGFARRFLLSWVVVSAAGLAFGAATGWYPPDRVLMFAFCLPLLAAFGLVLLGETLGRWWLAWPVGIVLVALIVAPAVRDWRDSFPYMSSDEVTHMNLAARIAVDRSAPGTPLVYIADSHDPNEALFLLTHAANVARATVPPDRVNDVHVFLGSPSDLAAGHASVTGDSTYDTASSWSFAQIPPGPHLTFVIGEEIRDPTELATSGLTLWDPNVASSEGSPTALAPLPNELAPVEPRKILAGTWRTFLLLMVLGLGWAWFALGDLVSGVAAAPAFAAPLLALTAFALERLGAPLGSPGWSVLACALSGGLGYALLARRLLEQRRHRQRDLVLEQAPALDA
ncbi:MAG TPA: hypothetical protein VHW68_05865 [Actinomycetota bacterium]|nr:hypothetical protein [Actinomycetota bacterium]